MHTSITKLWPGRCPAEALILGVWTAQSASRQAGPSCGSPSSPPLLSSSLSSCKRVEDSSGRDRMWVRFRAGGNHLAMVLEPHRTHGGCALAVDVSLTVGSGGASEWVFDCTGKGCKQRCRRMDVLTDGIFSGSDPTNPRRATQWRRRAPQCSSCDSKVALPTTIRSAWARVIATLNLPHFKGQWRHCSSIRPCVRAGNG
jgi:hypothetical protein